MHIFVLFSNSFQTFSTESDQCLIFISQGQLIPDDIDPEEGIDEIRYCSRNIASPTSSANSEKDSPKFQISLL